MNWKLGYFVGIFLTFTGCAIQPNPDLLPTIQYLAQNPSPKPDFINSVEPGPGTVSFGSPEINVQIYTGAIVEAGDTGATLQEQILSSRRFFINGQALPDYVYVRWEIPGVMNSVVHGVATGAIYFIFNPDLAAGTHLLEVQVRSTSNKLYSYSWVIEVATPISSTTTP
ncbi:MAG: hypothetical protein K8L97_01875 [Anaerolineae bacterium]|nr:hypothetical protein [Anaerolineae bacterium]